MEAYVRNRTCGCQRCMACDLMGAAVLITLGVLFLLSVWAGIRFHNTWPVILIVIGVLLFLRSSGSTAGHISPVPPSVTAASTPAPGSAPATTVAETTKDPSHG